MRQIAASLSRIPEGIATRLEVPEYYGFASWNRDDKCYQAIFMRHIKEENLENLLDNNDPRLVEYMADLEAVLQEARNQGIKFMDTTSNNFFIKARDKEGMVRYIIIDQA